MTPALKSAILTIWTSETFAGSREDARRMAMAGLAQPSDIFAGEAFDLSDNTDEQEPADPNQLTLFGGME